MALKSWIPYIEKKKKLETVRQTYNEKHKRKNERYVEGQIDMIDEKGIQLDRWSGRNRKTFKRER